MQLSAEDIAEVTRLEEAMWIAAPRFGAAFQQVRLAPDFLELGRSGPVHARAQIIRPGRGEIAAQPEQERRRPGDATSPGNAL